MNKQWSILNDNNIIFCDNIMTMTAKINDSIMSVIYLVYDSVMTRCVVPTYYEYNIE